jgi:hypothetical protein
MRSSTSGAGEGILTRRRGGGVVETAVLCRLGAAREHQKMNANRKTKVGAARRADPSLRRERAVSHYPIPPAEALGRGGSVVETAVVCSPGAARECRKMNANRKAHGRVAWPR